MHRLMFSCCRNRFPHSLRKTHFILWIFYFFLQVSRLILRYRHAVSFFGHLMGTFARFGLTTSPRSDLNSRPFHSAMPSAFTLRSTANFSHTWNANGNNLKRNFAINVNDNWWQNKWQTLNEIIRHLTIATKCVCVATGNNKINVP